MLSPSRRLAGALAVAVLALTACGSNDGPTLPAITGVTAVALSPTTNTVTFTSATGDDSYEIQHAEGSASSFTVVGTVDAPAAPDEVDFDDSGLKCGTMYRYRVVSIKGSERSDPSTEVSSTTQLAGTPCANITGDITASRTLHKDTTYTLEGFIHVANNATLTIEAGTKILGDYATLGSSLMVLRGAKIQAVGTAAAPIVFTSSRAAGTRQPGDWGGLLLIGNAVDNRTGTLEIEGSGTDGDVVASGKNYSVIYSGGNNDADNSGTLTYVRVEFAGFAPSLNNEFNSFTFAAVGSGTHISYTQAIGGLDDSYEFFGGALQGDHMVAYETGDDMFDMSEGFHGTLQYLIGYSSNVLTPRTGAGFLATDKEGVENDGCAGSGCDNGFDQQPFTIPVMANFTIVGCGAVDCAGSGGGFGMMIRRGSGGYYVNGVLARFAKGAVSMRDNETYKRAGSVTVPNMATTDLAIKNIYFSEVGGIAFEAPGANPQNAFDLAGNALTLGAATAASLFTALPAQGTSPASVSGLDWTPAAGSPIIAGGMAAFAGKLLTAANGIVVGTSYLGAADPAGAKWWSGWTVYVRN
jgi:hypothetical protein